MLSVLIVLNQKKNFSYRKAGSHRVSPTETTAFLTALKNLSTIQLKTTCEKAINNPLRKNSRNRYLSASLTVEASFAFPLFFFAVFYLLQMFLILKAELNISSAGILAAKEASGLSYVAERLADGEEADQEKLSEAFGGKLFRDTAVTVLFREMCDSELLKLAGVAKGLTGLYIDMEETGAVHEMKISYAVNPERVLFPMVEKRFYVRIRYRNYTGEGERKKKAEEDHPQNTIVYLATKASVYHLYADCSFIKINPLPVKSVELPNQRNASGAKYYPCEYCHPDSFERDTVYITKEGKRYHAVSSCSAISRRPEEKALSEVKETLPVCKKCKARKEKEEETENEKSANTESIR